MKFASKTMHSGVSKTFLNFYEQIPKLSTIYKEVGSGIKLNESKKNKNLPICSMSSKNGGGGGSIGSGGGVLTEMPAIKG